MKTNSKFWFGSSYQTKENRTLPGVITIYFLLLIVPKIGYSQHWHIDNWSDCNLTVTLKCGSIIEISNTYTDTWAGSWQVQLVMILPIYPVIVMILK